MISIDNIKETFAGLVAVDSPSLKERKMADYLKKLFGDIGIVLEEDDSAPETGSSAGFNLAIIGNDLAAATAVKNRRATELEGDKLKWARNVWSRLRTL